MRRLYRIGVRQGAQRAPHIINQTRRHIMTDLISKLSKADQRAVKLAMMHINYGNKDATIRVIDGMVRAANNRSESTLKAIRAAL